MEACLFIVLSGFNNDRFFKIYYAALGIIGVCLVNSKGLVGKVPNRSGSDKVV